MTSTEVSTALRPFYFSVHPDLFGQYPDQRQINETSLKQLSSYLESLQRKKYPKPCTLQFYIRVRDKQSNTLKMVWVKLKDSDVRKAVLSILQSCELSTEYVDKIPEEKKKPPNTVNNKSFNFDFTFKNFKDIDPIFGPLSMKQSVAEEMKNYTLEKWLKEHHLIALERSKLTKPIRQDISKLKKIVLENYEVLDVKWDCGWNESQFRGCLQSFLALAEQHPEPMHILKGRTLVFAPFTGVSLDGHIMLYTGEVRHNWLDLIRNVKKYDEVLLRIPGFEKTVSQVLKDIKVVRRKFMPKILAGEYERQLQQLTTNLSDYRGLRGYPKHWPNSLATFEIVVETEAGPLMVSPTGQFIVPSSCPGSLLVNFISENLDDAKRRLETYRMNKHVERSFRSDVLKHFKMETLHKDDNVNPDLMIDCCKKLLKHESKLVYLRGLQVNIATYYSVLSDGVVCIPWNFEI
ncbi:T-cell activation inhibitor, mitochondrial isoform X2 [Onthophagus taurus]|nr:T-cell activation inhibitor, mitochondrial isoform X2 [Onthophagus taurus]